ERVEAHHAYVSGIQLLSVLNSNISDCYIHHIRDKQPPANVHYGIAVSSASQNVSITGCRFSHTRHAVTTGGSSGTLANGVQRNIVISNCTSTAADTAHFDTHDPAENVSYVGCVAIGGVKTIIIAGGAVTQIAIDGTSTGLPAGVFKLGVGETIAVTYSSTPTSRVAAD